MASERTKRVGKRTLRTAKGATKGAIAGAAIGALSLGGASYGRSNKITPKRSTHGGSRGNNFVALHTVLGAATGAIYGGALGASAGAAHGLARNSHSSNSGHEGHFHSAKNMSGAHGF